MHFLSILSILITFFPPAYFIVKIQYIIHITDKICVNRHVCYPSVFWSTLGYQQLSFWRVESCTRIFNCAGHQCPSPSHNSWVNCPLLQQTHQYISFTQFYRTACELPGTILMTLTRYLVHCTYSITVSSLNIHLVSSVWHISGTEFGIQI